MGIIFRKTCLIFCMLCVCVLLCIAVLRKVHNEIDYKLDLNKNVLVIGDSHTECAIKDTLNIINLSMSGMPYIFTYPTIKKFVDQNSHIDTVILSYHPNALSREIEDKWIFNQQNIDWKVSSRISFLDIDLLIEDLSLFNVGLSYVRAPMYNAKLVFNSLILRNCLSYKSLGVGGYLSLDRVTKEGLDREYSSPISMSKEDVSLLQFKYLKLISEFCIERNIKLLLVSTPEYSSIKYNSENLLDEFDIKADYYDHRSIFVDNFLFADGDHMNSLGASVYTSFLLNSIK